MATQIRKGARLHYYIKEWMDHLDISDEKMAGLMNVSRTTVWKRYTEQHRLTPEKIAQIADALERNPKELLFPPEVPSLDAIAEGASEAQRAAMVGDILQRMKRTG